MSMRQGNAACPRAFLAVRYGPTAKSSSWDMRVVSAAPSPVMSAARIGRISGIRGNPYHGASSVFQGMSLAGWVIRAAQQPDFARNGVARDGDRIGGVVLDKSHRNA